MAITLNTKYRFDCPFCLSANSAKLVRKSYRRHNVGRVGYYVGCQRCFARGPLVTALKEGLTPTSEVAIIEAASEKWEMLYV